MNITLKQLQIFKAVASLSQVKLAAKQQNMSQPAVSMALTELEKQLNCQLFDRTGNRLKLNQQGYLLLPMASELLERSQEIADTFQNPDHPLNGLLTLGSSTTIGNYLLPKTLARFELKHPGVSTHLTIHNTSTIINKLLKFEVDLACIEGPCQHPDIINTPWMTDNLVILCSPQHLLTSQNKITFNQLNDCHWILREPGSGTRALFDQHIGQYLSTPNIRMELNQTEAIKQLVLSGLGITCLSELCAIKELERKELIQLPLRNVNLSRQLSLIIHRRKYNSPLLKTLRMELNHPDN
ncbi:hypothetical protein ACH42_01680 [Endozoicomonas sp. (ex Bugula neritina AB1)]|nr:hypothetical protein ACH42_01680 [Endozoicomonas sp. (ex Bugula neritina AB1)]